MKKDKVIRHGSTTHYKSQSCYVCEGRKPKYIEQVTHKKRDNFNIKNYTPAGLENDEYTIKGLKLFHIWLDKTKLLSKRVIALHRWYYRENTNENFSRDLREIFTKEINKI